MKKITFLLLMLGFSSLISAQCLTSFYGQYPFGSYVIPVCDGLVQNNITTCGFASEYSVVSVTSGETYTFGSSTTTDIVTISTDLGVTAETFGTGSVSWVATVTGDIWFYTSLDDGACGAENTCRTRYVICGIPPTCIAPSNLVSSNITTTSATVSWTTSVTDPAFGYEYYLSTSSTTPLPTDPATAGEAPGVTTTVLTDLIPATVYYVWVRSICSATDTSGWSSVVSFPTLCNPVTDFTESFDDALDLPVCWAKVGTGGSAYVQTSGTTTSPPNNLYFASWSATDLGIVSMIPVSNAGDGTHRLRFRARSNFTVGGVIEVGYLTDPSDDTTFVGLQTFATTSTNTFDYFSAILGTAPGANQVLAFRHTGVPSNSVLIDDVIWEPLPSCVEPSPLAVSGVTDTSADLAWTTSVSNPSGYEYVLDEIATDPTVAGVLTTSISFNATALNPLTTYYFHVRAKCSSTSNSAWLTVSFTTLATPPSNDNCMNAISITAGSVFIDSPVVGTTIGGLTMNGLTFACQVNRKNDVWYTVVVPASGTLTVETDTTTGTTMMDSVLSVFSGTCGSLTEVGCDDDSGNGNFSKVVLSALTPGTTLYIGVWTYSTTVGGDGDFQLSAYDASLSNNAFSNSNFTFYPNPVKDILNLSYSQNISKVQVINLLGQEMIVKTMNETQGQIDMSPLSAGTYLVKVTSEEQVKTIKVIKE